MSDYTELVKTLRELSVKNSLSFWKRGVCKDAAAAIEDLQRELSLAEIAADDNGRQVEELQAEVAELKRVNMEIFEDLPKRGEWIGRRNHKKCSVCGKQAIYDVALCTDMKTPYCPNCGAKMEVQDG